MKSYYTCVCNFYYGKKSVNLVKKKKALPLHGNNRISFDQIRLITRNSEKKLHFKKIKTLSKSIKKKIEQDLKQIIKKKKNFSNLNFTKTNIMGVLNLTPDSFSDGGKFNSLNSGFYRALDLYKSGADVVDIGGESTRPGSTTIPTKIELNRIKGVLKKLSSKNVSLDTRKSSIMKFGIKAGVNIINDVSGLMFDKDTIKVLKRYKIPFVLQHSQGDPTEMQKNPKYKNAILDIYDFFEQRLIFLRKAGITHNKIIIDPGIGFGKNLKHNLSILRNISIFHSLGFPILLGISRKKFIKEISGSNDTKKRLGGTISASIYASMQGIQILRIHDVKEVIQSLKVFDELIKN